MTAVTEKRIHAAFEIGVILKGLDGVLECVAGLALYFTSIETIVALVTALANNEILGDKRDVVESYLTRAAEHFSVGGKRFAAFYLLSHGVVKLILVAGLLRGKMWAYPASLAVLALFIAYQLYRLTFAYSIILVLLTVFDVAVIWLIWQEYRIVEAHRAPR